MKPCPHCGKELPQEMKFCPYCMQKLIVEQPIVPPAPKRRLVWLPITVGIAAASAVFVLIVSVLFHLIHNGLPLPLNAKSDHTDPARTTVPTVTITATTTANVGGPSADDAVNDTGKQTDTVTSGSSSTTATTTTTQPKQEMPVACTHNWQAVTQSIKHDEVGHYDQVITGYNTVTIYKCAVCYDTFETLDDYYTHFEDHLATSDPLLAVFRDRYETDTRQTPVYGNQWVVDQKAYTETVTVGYRCTVCGDEKQAD